MKKTILIWALLLISTIAIGQIPREENSMISLYNLRLEQRLQQLNNNLRLLGSDRCDNGAQKSIAKSTERLFSTNSVAICKYNNQRTALPIKVFLEKIIEKEISILSIDSIYVPNISDNAFFTDKDTIFAISLPIPFRQLSYNDNPSRKDSLCVINRFTEERSDWVPYLGDIVVTCSTNITIEQLDIINNRQEHEKNSIICRDTTISN